MSREPERVNSDTSDPSRLQMAGAFLSQASAAAGVRVGGEEDGDEKGEGEREETVACADSSVSIFKGSIGKKKHTHTHWALIDSMVARPWEATREKSDSGAQNTTSKSAKENIG